MKKAFLLLLLCFGMAFMLQARHEIKVRLFSDKTIREVQLYIFSGNYQLQDSSGITLYTYLKGDTLRIFPFDSGMVVISRYDTVFTNDFLRLHGSGFMNIFQTQTPLQQRLYDDHAEFRLRPDGTMWLINVVELEHYVAGVVQAEAGIAKNNEFYKVQAIAVRTYSLKNIEKHRADGYHLCDQTHCQVYKGRCGNADIMLSTSATAGMVMVDSLGQLIIAVFHSNSGGQTANSEDVWSKRIPYLRSVNDTYSVGQPSYSWKKTMKRSEWLEYLRKNFEFPVNNPLEVKKVTSFQQTNRMAYLTGNISLRKIREDMGLRSTFFNISEQGDEIVFTGKGFGHGVGMSQEGAINMARSGYGYVDILKFYYLGIEITTIDALGIQP